MKFGPYSFEDGGRPKSAVRQLAVPAIIAGAVCAGLAFYVSKRTKPEPEKPSEWTINWIELSDYKKPETKTTSSPAAAKPADSSTAASGNNPSNPKEQQ